MMLSIFQLKFLLDAKNLFTGDETILSIAIEEKHKTHSVIIFIMWKEISIGEM